jgi:hypothetical protein
MKAKKIAIQLRDQREHDPVRIIADAAVSTRGFHGGRLLPLLLLDTSERPDIAELIHVHQYCEPGDHRVQWDQISGHEGTVAVFLNFIRPLEFFMSLEFDIVKQGILVEQALIGQGIYLAEAEACNDRFAKNVDRPKIIVELPDTGYREVWDKLFQKHLTKHFRMEGLGRSDSRRAAESAIQELRRFATMQMRDVVS